MPSRNHTEVETFQRQLLEAFKEIHTSQQTRKRKVDLAKKRKAMKGIELFQEHRQFMETLGLFDDHSLLDYSAAIESAPPVTCRTIVL